MRALFDKILNFFGLQKIPSKNQIEVANNLKEFELIKINNSRLEALEKKIIMNSVGLERINVELSKQREEIAKDREFLVHIATLHEELLNQMDQGNVVMVKRPQMAESKNEEIDFENQTEYPKKHKFSIN